MNDISNTYDGAGLGEDKNPLSNPDILMEQKNESETHPSPEMFLIREAIKKTLMRDQRELWEMYAYDKLLPAEIARKLKVSKQAIGQRLKVIEKKITVYCNEHKEVYDTMKALEDYDDNSQGC